MTLANMRENGVHSVIARCAKCRHEGVLEVQRWPADTPVPDVGLKLRCSACGGRDIDTRPTWLSKAGRGCGDGLEAQVSGAVLTTAISPALCRPPLHDLRRDACPAIMGSPGCRAL